MRKLKTLFALLVLSFFTIGNVWAETITLTYDDVSATSYSSSEQTFTNGVQFGYVYLMRNGTNGQPSGWAANQVMQVSKSSNNGLLYNKAPISRITNIRVYVVVNTNAFTLTYGNTTACDAGSISRPTTATGSESITYSSYADKKVTPGQSTTATYYDFDLSSSKPTYFKITNGSGVLYIWKVVITYTPEYAVSFSNPEHGSISVKNGVADVTSGDKFPANTTLTVTAAPTVENTYRETIKVIKTGVTPEADVTASVLSGSTLTMPAYPITISAEETQLFEIRTAVVVADEVGAQGNTATVNGESVVYVSEDDDLTLVATHAAGYEFVEWTTNNDDHIAITSSTSASTTATIDAAVTITAHFQASVNPSIAIPASVNFGTVRQHAIGTDDTEHMLEVIEINGANLTGDVTLTAATTGGGSIFDLTGYRPSITLSPTAGAISSNVTVIAATGFSDKATYNGTITVHSEVSDFVDKTINLSITITPTYEVAIAVNDANMGSATLNGGTAAIYAASEDELTLVATPKSGYEFVNWTLSSDNLLIDDEDAASTTANTIVGDETITANFRLKPTFTWIVNGEETTETANTGATLTQKPTPTATLGGKAFVGWTTTPIVGEAVSSTYIANTPATMPEGGATYYAVYAKVDQEAAVYKDTIDMTESVTGWSTTNTDEYFSQPYGMKSVNKYTLNKSISNFSSYANSAESITIGVKCLQNNGTTSRLTISLVDEDGNVIDGTGKVVTPVNATSASNTTYQTVNYSASEVQDKDATGYKIQCTTYGKNVLVNGTAYIINVPASLSAYATNQYAVTFNATPSDGTVAIKNGETPISSGDKFWSGTKLDVTATPTTAGYKLITLTANGTDIKDAKYFTIAAADVEVVATFEDATALDNLESEGKAVKVLIDGQIFILRDGKTYTIQGQLVK